MSTQKKSTKTVPTLRKANIELGYLFLLDITYKRYLIEPSHKIICI